MKGMSGGAILLLAVALFSGFLIGTVWCLRLMLSSEVGDDVMVDEGLDVNMDENEHDSEVPFEGMGNEKGGKLWKRRKKLFQRKRNVLRRR